MEVEKEQEEKERKETEKEQKEVQIEHEPKIEQEEQIEVQKENQAEVEDVEHEKQHHEQEGEEGGEEREQSNENNNRKSVWAHRQFTIPPKEALDNKEAGVTKKLAIGELLESLDSLEKSIELGEWEKIEKEEENIQTSDISQNQPQPLQSSPIRLSASSLSSNVAKNKKGNVLQASLEFGIAGVALTMPIPPSDSSSSSSSSSSPSSVPVPPPAPTRLEKSKSQSALSRVYGLFSSSSESLQSLPDSSSSPLSSSSPSSPSPSSPTPTPSPSSPSSDESEFRGLLRKITTRFTSAPNLITPMQHDFRGEIKMLLPPPQPPSQTASNLVKIIHEIIATEWEYLGDLLALSDIQNMMVTHHVVEQMDAMRIFGNVDQILMTNLELYRTFQKREWDCKESTEKADLDVLAASIAEAFVAMAAYLRMYAAYSSKHEDSLQLLKTLSCRSDVKIFLMHLAKQPVCKGLALQSLLIKPIQRVCKYPLLLRELLKYVENPVTRPQIEMAMAKIEETLVKVNEHQKMADRMEKMAKLLQELLDGGVNVESLDLATRHFTSQGSLNAILNGKTKVGHYYLFNDLFLWTRRSLGYIKLEATIPLKEALLVDITSPAPGTEHGFEISHAGQKKWQFFTEKPEDCAPIRKAISDAIEAIYSELLNAK